MSTLSPTILMKNVSSCVRFFEHIVETNRINACKFALHVNMSLEMKAKTVKQPV